MTLKSSITFLTIYSILCINGYPSGAPVDRCESMLPGHNVDPLDDDPPFAITVDPIPDSASFKGKIKNLTKNLFEFF
jgi:hypothetical protein